MAKQKYNGAFGPRIMAIIDYLNMNRNGLASALGYPYASITNYAHGKQEPPCSFFRDLLKLIPELSPLWFFFGIGEMIVDKTPEQKRIEQLEAETIRLIKMRDELVLTLHGSNKALSEYVNRMIAAIAIFPQKMEDYDM